MLSLLHTATLVHDDVVDDSMKEEVFSPFMPLENKVSVLVGDYLLSKRAYYFHLDNNDFRILQLLSDAVRQMSEGELLQIEKSRSLKSG